MMAQERRSEDRPPAGDSSSESAGYRVERGGREHRVAAQSLAAFRALLGQEEVAAAEDCLARIARQFEGRAIWNVSASKGTTCVSEAIRSFAGYARGSGLDVRWFVLSGSPRFRMLTQRLAGALQESEVLAGAEPLTEADRSLYEEALRSCSAELAGHVRPGDVVLLHDPETAGLIPPLQARGAHAVWRCHHAGEGTTPGWESAWRFLAPYIAEVKASIFSRRGEIPRTLELGAVAVVTPTLDPFSAKNQPLDDATCRAILVRAGIIEGPPGPGEPTISRSDGSPARIDRRAELWRLGRAPTWDTPLVIQVARWDRDKDPVGVLNGFAQTLGAGPLSLAELVLAGPNPTEDPSDAVSPAVFEQACSAWRALPHAIRQRVHLVCLPIADAEENAGLVNALQRHATVVVQKSLREGFGLVVTEAMWKGKPVVASAVGGIPDQISDGEHGSLVKDPRDVKGFATALRGLLLDRSRSLQLGQAARERVRERFLEPRGLVATAKVLESVV